MLDPISRKNKKNITNLSSAESAHSKGESASVEVSFYSLGFFPCHMFVVVVVFFFCFFLIMYKLESLPNPFIPADRNRYL